MLLTSRRSIPLPALLALSLAVALSTAVAAPAAGSGAAAVPEDLLLPYTVTLHDTLIGLNRTLFTEPGAWREVSRINHLPDSNKINPGQTLLVPARFLHDKVVPATLASAFGDVRIAGKPAAAGARLDVGEAIRTGDGSTADRKSVV